MSLERIEQFIEHTKKIRTVTEGGVGYNYVLHSCLNSK
jgi:hypothetical protein